MNELLASAVFTVFVLGMLAIDLGVFHRRAHRISMREAMAWSAFWIVLSLAFNYGLYRLRGPEVGLQFLTGYVIEKSLSMDNLFVFAVIFTYMGVPPRDQHKVLYWGILGALAMRAAFIAAGVALISHFHWILYVFGAFLLYSGAKLFKEKLEKVQPERNPVLRLARKIFAVTEGFVGDSFFVRREGKTFATPLLFVLLMIETTDVLFAVDSIPAVFSVTQDPFIVYTSNILAILGLRALYFVLAGALGRFRFLRPGLALILIFVGIKMLAVRFYKIPTHISLLLVVGVLAASILLSLMLKPAAERRANS